ncbi:MAG: LTA synthase family protein [Lachnospirales bacterium]
MSKKKVRVEKKGREKNKSAMWLFLGILCIIISSCVNYYTPERVAVIKFVATGEKNAFSLGNNVRISKLTDDNDKKIDFNDLQLEGDWKIDEQNNLLTCYNVSKSSDAFIQVRNIKSLNVDFVSEIGSGVVEVYINDELLEKIDLFSNNQWSNITKNYNIKYPMTYAYNVFCILFFAGGIFFIIFFIKKNYSVIKIKIKNFRFSPLQFKKALYTGVFAAFSYIIVFTAFQDFVYSNFYDDNVILTITATGEKDRNSLSDNVRITGIKVNGSQYDFSEIKLKDGWEYSSTDHMIYIYGTLKAASFDVEVENVRTIDISYVKEVGSGIFDISVDGKVVNKVNSYKNCQWEEEVVRYKANPLINPYSSYSVLITLFLFFFALGYFVFYKEEKWNKIFHYIKFLVINILFSVIIYFFISFIQRESFVETIQWAFNNGQNFFEGLCIVALLNIFLAMLLKKNYRSFVLLSVIFIFLLTVNYFKLQFRDNPLFPWDFLLASVAATVVSRFKLVPSLPFAIGVLTFILVLILFLFVYKKRKEYIINKTARFVTAIVSFTLLFIYFSTYLFSAGVNLFEAKEYYTEKGFVAAFAESSQYLRPIDKPENYNEDTMNDIYDKISLIPEKSDSKKANVIVIMSESFWDITRVKELGFDAEIFPTYRNLQKTSVTGELLTNVYNGGTVNSEFEALTGFSVAYLPTEYMPYQRCMRPNFFSINSYLKSEGYETLAIHPFEKTNYNRNTAYEYLKFDKTLWEEDFDEDADRMRGYISDHALTEKIISEYEKHNSSSDAPWFNLSVSMQNHGGYWESSIDSDKNYNINTSNFNKNSQGSIRDLAIGLHYADLALGELIDYFKNVDEPTVIIMFGDHMSNAGPIGETLLDQSELLKGKVDLSVSGKNVLTQSEQSVLEQRRVPFMAWSNYGNTKKDSGLISVTQLLPTVFSEYNVTMPKYFEYLKNSKNIYPACASGIFVDKDGNVGFVDNMTEEEKKQYDEYWLIEYDYIFGKNYLKDLFDY